jgi:hypothetical protein
MRMYEDIEIFRRERGWNVMDRIDVLQIKK